MRLGVFHRHLGKLAEGDDFAANQFRQLDLAPRIGFALLVERECITAAADFLTVLLAVNVVVDPLAAGTDRALEYAFHFWSGCSLHSTSDVLIVPTGTKTGTKQKSHTGESSRVACKSFILSCLFGGPAGIRTPNQGIMSPLL
jgi:hypothetical protein